jgi:hypothetical protein
MSIYQAKASTGEEIAIGIFALKTLTGDHNQCQSCKRYFNSTSAFDKHRIGEFGVDRRCMTDSEMTSRQMCIDARGWWIGEKLSDENRAKLTTRWATRKLVNKRLSEELDPDGHPAPEVGSQSVIRGCKQHPLADSNPANYSAFNLGATP